jgi:RNA polymerase sigma-70 factor (ECF subfamily)
MTEISDQILVQRARQGDCDSFAQLCTRYYPALMAVARALLLDHHSAEDAAQEALAEAVRQFETLKKPEAFGSWIRAICRNVAKDMLRHRQRESLARPCKEVQLPPDLGEEKLLLLKSMEQLPVHLREVLMLRYLNQQTYEQMSSILGLSEQAINGRLRRAKKKLASQLKKHGVL